MKVLVIEDNDELNALLVQLLELKSGVQVSGVTCPKIGIEIALQHEFDFIICDFLFPAMTGHQVFRELRHRGKNSPFILWTAVDHSQLPKFDSVGFVGIVPKPEIDKILATLKVA